MGKGYKPLSTRYIVKKFNKIWSEVAEWKIVPLDKAFFDLRFSNAHGKRKAWPLGSCNLKLGLFIISRWELEFNPNISLQTHVQAWVRIYDVPQEYWRPSLLFEIVGGLGTC